MVQLIASIIFLVSLLGILFILGRKIPELATLPQNGHHGFKKTKLVISLEKKIKETYFQLFEKQLLLHKLLSFVKVWTLRIETKIDHLLHGIRKKAQQLDKEVGKKKKQ